MDHQPLGRTGIRVSHWCLGAMMFGPFGNEDAASCTRIAHACMDAGVNFIDTADAYSAGVSEEIVGKAVRGRRDDVVIATKCFMPMGRDPNMRGGSRRWIVRAVEDSLRRLGTDWIDLYQLHRLDPATDPEESLSAMSDLVRQGKIRVIGTSTARAEQIVECQWICERRGFERVRCEQPPYSIFSRGIEAGVLPTCERYGLGTLVWGPLGGGWLAGKYRRDAPPPEGTRAAKGFFDPKWWDWQSERVQRKFDVIERLEELAAEAGLSLPHLALAFCREHPAVSSTIIGPRTEEQCEELLRGADVRLSADVLDRIDALVPPGVDLDPGANVEINPALTSPVARRRSLRTAGAPS